MMTQLIPQEKSGKYLVSSQGNQSFLDSNQEPTKELAIPTREPSPSPERESIKHTLIGSPKAVMGTIHVLHRLGYANVGDWSPLLPGLNSGEVMSILIRNISVQ